MNYEQMKDILEHRTDDDRTVIDLAMQTYPKIPLFCIAPEQHVWRVYDDAGYVAFLIDEPGCYEELRLPIEAVHQIADSLPPRQRDESRLWMCPNCLKLLTGSVDEPCCNCGVDFVHVGMVKFNEMHKKVMSKEYQDQFMKDG